MKQKQTGMCPSEREAQSQQKNKRIEIFVKKIDSDHGQRKYRWAWKESAEMNVFGVASTLEEVKIRTKRMFPDSEIILLPL